MRAIHFNPSTNSFNAADFVPSVSEARLFFINTTGTTVSSTLGAALVLGYSLAIAIGVIALLVAGMNIGKTTLSCQNVKC